MDVRALSHPSIQYSLPYREGVRQELDPSVVLTLLDVALFLEDGYEYAVLPGWWYGLRGHYAVEQLTESDDSKPSQTLPYLCWDLVAAHRHATNHALARPLRLCLVDGCCQSLGRFPLLRLHSRVLFIHQPAEVLTPSLPDILVSRHHYIVPRSRLNTVVYSFYPRAIRIWNTVPKEITEITQP